MNTSSAPAGAAETLDDAAPTVRVPVLIVDDNAAKRLGIKAALEPLGCSVVQAESGPEALRCLLAQDFAVILLDVRMPIMDGFETAALIRTRERSESTPIIFMTAYGRDEISEDLYAGGAVDFLFAPIPPKELRAKVNAFGSLYLKAQSLATKAEAVQTSADQLRVLTEAAPIGIFQTDAQNRYVYTNPRWTEITGLDAAAAIGEHWDTIVDEHQRSELMADLPDGHHEWAELSHRFEIDPPGRPSRIVMVTSRSIQDPNGGIAGWVGTLADVTAEAGAEAAMADARDKANEATRLKSDFLANMSHEIRTPMNGVIGMTELLLETNLDARQVDYVETVRDSGAALLTVINDILDFSKVEAGKLELANAPFSLRTTVDDVLDLLRPSARTKALELDATIERTLPAFVLGDAGRLRQVLLNLLGNAIKFTSAGTIGLWIRRQDDLGAHTVVRFDIVDSGDGIAADKLTSIFEPFVQADTSASRRHGGTGLGLAISAKLVALMGGECGVSSEPGAGSTFWFTIRVPAADAATSLPVDPVPSAEFRVDTEPAASWAAEGTLGTLLLAEDNLVNQKVTVAMLSGSGYRIDTVLDGAAAVRAAAAFPYDAVLMDCQLPELSGYDATAAIRAQEGTGRHVPIIAMTAGALADDRSRCLAAGMDGYLSKPMSKSDLLSLVAHSVANGGHEAPREVGSPHGRA